MKKLLKKLINKILFKYGYELQRRDSLRTTLAEVLNHISRFEFLPQTVIDVGVAKGTWELYEFFPSAMHVLIEPLEEFSETLQEISRKYKTQIVTAAACDFNGKITINVHSILDGSSMMQESEGTHVDGIPREVQAITIDSVIESKKLIGPFIIKIDVQGGELLVLQGSKNTLNKTEVIILETQLFQFFKKGPQFIDIVHYMNGLGFFVYDIFGQQYRPLDGALASVDLVFVKDKGLFRQSHHWATIEQRLELDNTIIRSESNA